MAIAEIERVGAELRLEQALEEIARAADDLRTLAELQAERAIGPVQGRFEPAVASTGSLSRERRPNPD